MKEQTGSGVLEGAHIDQHAPRFNRLPSPGELINNLPLRIATATTIALFGAYGLYIKLTGNTINFEAGNSNRPSILLVPPSTPTAEPEINSDNAIVPQILGLTPKLETMRGNKTVIYFTNRDNPYGLGRNVPVGLYDPELFLQNTEDMTGIALAPNIITYLHLAEELPNIKIYPATFNIAANIDNFNQDQETEPITNHDIDPKVLFEPIKSDGIEIYGGLNTISKEQLPLLIQYLNSQQNQKDTDTFYASFFVDKDVYDIFPGDNFDQYMESFLAKHATALEEKFSQEGKHTKIKFRRMILIENSNQKDAVDLKGLNDSDSTWSFDKPYKPSSYYDFNAGIDSGLLNQYADAVSKTERLNLGQSSNE